MRIRLGIVCLACAWPAAAGAAVLHVWTNSPAPAAPYDDWTTAARDLQTAVDAAVPGDLILAANGFYETGGRRYHADGPTNRVVLDKAITLRTVSGPENAFIAGGGTGGDDSAVRCAYVGSNAVLQGFTLTNGRTRGFGTDWITGQSGGGAWCEASGLLLDCVLTGNRAFFNGGGLQGGTAQSCRFIGNHANNYGGGAAEAALVDGLVSLNYAGYGGGLYRGTAQTCTVATNYANASGGGAFQTAAENGIFVGNQCFGGAETGGGGIYQGEARRCAFRGNVATEHGGGAYDADLFDSELDGNEADYGGGAAYSRLSACTATANRALFDGGGAYASRLETGQVIGNRAGTNWYGQRYGLGGGLYLGSASGTLIAGNEAVLRGGGACSAALTNCTVQFNRATNDVGTNAGQGGGVAGGRMVGGLLASNLAHSGGGASSADLSGVHVLGNSADVVSNYAVRGQGGGAFRSTLADCVVERNDAGWGGHGGGLSEGSAERCLLYRNVAQRKAGSGEFTSGLGGGAFRSALTNCVVHYNTGQGAGGGVASGRVVQCTVVDNYASAWDGGGLYGCTALCSIVYSNLFRDGLERPDSNNHVASTLSGCFTLPASGDNSAADPQWDPADPLFRLLSNSPCIDFLADVVVSLDYSGVGRPLDGDHDGTGRADAGAHEFVHPLADSDGDGMPDRWEIDGDLDAVADDAGLDRDADGFQNRHEWLAGTAPNDPDSRLGFAHVAPGPDGPVLSWNSVAGKSYALSRSSNLAAGVWSPVASNLAADAPLNVVTDVFAPGSGPWTWRIELE